MTSFVSWTLTVLYSQTTAIPTKKYSIDTFVALGTSLPDLFASRGAAMNEKYADDAIGNVTGSNSVNVFLGLGLPWLIASIYHTSMVCLT
jgi:Ca2+/Na+ antiporter